MGITVECGIRDHHSIEALIPKGGMVAESYGKQRPSPQGDEQFDDRESRIFLKGPDHALSKFPGTEVADDKEISATTLATMKSR